MASAEETTAEAFDHRTEALCTEKMSETVSTATSSTTELGNWFLSAESHNLKEDKSAKAYSLKL